VKSLPVITAIKKLVKRKKRKGGFYQGTDILTPKEKQSLFITFFLLTFPLILTAFLFLLN
jgi:hypothetical protein